MTTDYLGVAGDAINHKLFLGDSAGYGDASLGLYGSLAERKAIKETLAKIAVAGAVGAALRVGGGRYDPDLRPGQQTSK